VRPAGDGLLLQEGGKLAQDRGSGNKLGYEGGGQVGTGVARVIHFRGQLGCGRCYIGRGFKGSLIWSVMVVGHFQSFGLSGGRLCHCVLL
jgi:hypothetical protein